MKTQPSGIDLEHSRRLVEHAERVARGQVSSRDPIPIAEQYTRKQVQIHRAKQKLEEAEDAA